MIPHVTHNDEADITELEAWRKQLNEEHARDGVKVTMVSFLVVASVAALKEFPNFNSSLDGDDLVLKRYYNIGFAADTPGGLVVPVIKDADQHGLLEIASTLSELSGQGSRRQAGAGGHAGRHVHDLVARRHRRNVVHADHQRARGRDPRRQPRRDEAGLERLGVRAAADGAAVALLRPPGDRRRRRRPLHRPPRPRYRDLRRALL